MTNEICCSNSRSIFPSFMKKNALLEANNGVFIFLFLFPFIQIPFLHVCVWIFLFIIIIFWQRDHLVNVLIHLSFYTYISQNMIHEQMLANKRNLHHFCWRWWFFLNALKIWFAQMGSFSCMDPVFLFVFCLFVCFVPAVMDSVMRRHYVPSPLWPGIFTLQWCCPLLLFARGLKEAPVLASHDAKTTPHAHQDKDKCSSHQTGHHFSKSYDCTLEWCFVSNN